MIIMSPELKPLMLLHLLHSEQYSLSSSLCFTKSVESATRLVKLIEFFEDAFILGGGSNTGKRVIAKSYSSELKETERRKLLDGLAKGSIDLYVPSAALHWPLTLLQARVFGSHCARYRPTVGSECYLVRRATRHAEIRSSCRQDCACWSRGQCLVIGRKAGSAPFQADVGRGKTPRGGREFEGQGSDTVAVHR
jgi:hypothetical protein